RSYACKVTTSPSQNKAKTRSPSLAGVDDAREFLACAVGTFWPGADLVHLRSPVVASKQSSIRCEPSRVALWRNTNPFTTIGDECPSPGTSAFHRTFLVADHSSGGSFPSAVPDPFGPRKRGQSAAIECWVLSTAY